MLCDTGAACSYLSRAFYESHLASMTPLVKQRKPQKLVSAGGTGLTTIGNVKTNIKLGGCSLPIEFFVVDNLTQDVILSAEFFKSMGVLIDYKRKRLSLYNESINMPLLTAIDPTRVVFTSRKIRIPPKHEALIPIKLTSKTGFDSGITEALPQTSRRGLSVASTLIRCITTSSMC